MKQTLVLTITASFFLVGCTENQRAKNFGGEAKVDLPQGTKFVTATWKEDDLWFAYRMARPGETPEVITLKEQSSFGLLQGKVVFTEH